MKTGVIVLAVMSSVLMGGIVTGAASVRACWNGQCLALGRAW